MSNLLINCGILVVACGVAARADSVTLTSSRDNTLFEDLVGLTSNGSGEAFFVGVNNSDNHRRGLLKFDLSLIPAGSTVTSVELTLHVSRSVSVDTPVALRRAFQDWGEGASNSGYPGGHGAPAEPGDATWLHTFFNTQSWSAPGGAQGVDFAATDSAVTLVGVENSYYVWGSEPGMVADAQAWVNAPGSNFGWFVIGDELTLGSAKRFDTRENADPAVRPQLVVTYSVPGCYANCDRSTSAPVLNANDFQCFLNLFAAQDPAANCDGSTSSPTLNANDFQCFLNAFAAGCT